MNYKKLYVLVILNSLFLVFWLNSYKCYINGIAGISNLNTLSNINTSYAGYGFLPVVGSIYVISYLLYLYINLPNQMIYYLVRLTRFDFLKLISRKIFLSSLIFTLCYVGINIILNCIFININLLINTGFFVITIAYGALFFLFCNLIGMLFFILYLVVNSFNKVMLIILITSIILTMISLLYSIWTPIMDTVLYDDYYMNECKINILEITGKIIRLFVVFLFLFYISKQEILSKDVFVSDNEYE